MANLDSELLYEQLLASMEGEGITLDTRCDDMLGDFCREVIPGPLIRRVPGEARDIVEDEPCWTADDVVGVDSGLPEEEEPLYLLDDLPAPTPTGEKVRTSGEKVICFAKTTDGKPLSEDEARALQDHINDKVEPDELEGAATLLLIPAGGVEALSGALRVRLPTLRKHLAAHSAFVVAYAAQPGRNGETLHQLYKSRFAEVPDVLDNGPPDDAEIFSMLLENIEAIIDRARPRRRVRIGVVSSSDIANSPGTRMDAGHYLKDDDHD